MPVPKLRLMETYEHEDFTLVTLQNKYGKYFGVSNLQEEDRPYASKIIGGNYAECHAHASYIKERLKDAKLQLKTMQNLKKDFEYSNLEVPRPVKLKIRDYTQQVDDLTNYLEYLRNYVKESDKARAKLRKKD